LSSKRAERTGKTWATVHGLAALGRTATSSRAMSNSRSVRTIDFRVTQAEARNATYWRPVASITGAGSPELQRFLPLYGMALGPSPTVQVAPPSAEE
jgi:hypothetical protein